MNTAIQGATAHLEKKHTDYMTTTIQGATGHVGNIMLTLRLLHACMRASTQVSPASAQQVYFFNLQIQIEIPSYFRGNSFFCMRSSWVNPGPAMDSMGPVWPDGGAFAISIE